MQSKTLIHLHMHTHVRTHTGTHSQSHTHTQTHTHAPEWGTHTQQLVNSATLTKK